MNSIARIVNAFPERIIFACAGFISLALYLLTTGQTVNFHDEAEFALRAYQLGATHSPGAPLFVLIGHMPIFLVSKYYGCTPHNKQKTQCIGLTDYCIPPDGKN